MHLIKSFGKGHNMKDEVKIHMIDDTLQMAKKIHLECFNFIFIFNPLENSAIIHAEKLNKKNKIFQRTRFNHTMIFFAS